MVRRMRSAVVLAVAFATAGCGGSSPQASSPTGSASPSVPLSAAATPSPSASASPSVSPSPTPTLPDGVETLEDGRHFGYVKSVDLTAGRLVFDLAEFLTGEAADLAAVEDGVIQEGEHVDNDYYIRNQNSRLRTLAFASVVDLKIVDWAGCCDTKDGDLAKWAASFEEPDPSGTYRGTTSPWWLTFDGGRITLIEEQYLP